MIPDAVKSWTSFGVNSVSISPSLPVTPDTSVSSKSRSAFKAAAICPATVSPFILNVSPLSPDPIGAITGIISASNKWFKIFGLISRGAPTKPNFGSSCSHVIRLASLPDSPTAWPPWAFIACTILLLTSPESTISTTLIVASSVTRFPFTNSDLMSRRLNIWLIIGPPP
ncbi:Uncharacterised protein [marine metagenome]